MSDTKFTPGPWSYWPMCCRIGGMVTTDAIGMHVCAPTFFEKDPTVTEANANLIAAAPEMYLALKAVWLQLLQSNNDSEYAQRASEMARVAIAKADGVQA